MPQRDDYEWVHVKGVATTIVSGVACKLINVCVNQLGANTISVYNAATSATCASTNLVGTLASSIIAGIYLGGSGIKLPTGLTVVTLSADSDITIKYANA